MPPNWQQLFRLLADHAPGIVPYWRMKDGAEFYLAIPDREDIQENGFAQEAEFLFTFDKVASLTIQPVVGPARLQITNDLDAARRAVSSTDGLTCQELGGELVVSPAEEPHPIRTGAPRRAVEGQTAAKRRSKAANEAATPAPHRRRRPRP
jgi:hypothetical protein